MTTIKERILGAVSIMNEADASSLWGYIFSHFSPNSLNNTEEPMLEEWELQILKKLENDPEYQDFKTISQQQRKFEYEARQKAILDYNQLIFEAEQRGKAKGIAKSLIAKGYSTDEIVQITDLSADQVDKLR